MENAAGSHSFLKILQDSAKKDERSAKEIATEECERLKSLQLKEDRRYKKMDFYRQHNDKSEHFSKIRKSIAPVEFVPPPFSEDLPLPRVPEPEERTPRPKAASVEERIEWQEAFDSSVKRLMIDFQLTDVPAARLRHLDQMADWFTDHGGKQARKVQKGPNFLVAERDGSMPAGSTKNVPSATGTSLQLAAAYSLRSPRPNTISEVKPSKWGR